MQRNGQESVWGMMTKDVQFLSGVLEVLHNCILHFLALSVSIYKDGGLYIAQVSFEFFNSNDLLASVSRVAGCIDVHDYNCTLQMRVGGWEQLSVDFLPNVHRPWVQCTVLEKKKNKKIQNLKWGNCIILKLYSNENVIWSAMCLSIGFCLAVSKTYISFH